MSPQNKAIALALAAALAVPAEGIRRVWYTDPVGIVTVCRGHTGPDIDKSKTYSLAECDALLTEDMRHAINTVDRCQPGLPPQVLAAFADLTFNAGPAAACDRTKSTAARLLAARQFRAACDQLPRWSKARVMGVMVDLPGLVKRRAAERDLCLQGAP